MGIPTNIRTLLSGDVVEWARIEFKETWDAEASLKTICAFANDIDNWGGGYLVIGVKDNCGIPDSYPGIPSKKIDAILKDMLNKCKRIQPEYMPIVEVSTYKGKNFIIGLRAAATAPIQVPKIWQRIAKSELTGFGKWQAPLCPAMKNCVTYTHWQIMFPLMTG